MSDLATTVSAYFIATVSLWFATREKEKVKRLWKNPIGPLLRLAVVFLGFHLLFLSFGISVLSGYLFLAFFVAVSFLGLWLDPFFVLLLISSYIFIEWVFWFPNRGSYIHSQAVKGERIKKEVEAETGIALSDLKPIGQIEIAGKKFDARSSLGFIDKGEVVKVVSQSGFELLVSKVEADQTPPANPTQEHQKSSGDHLM